MSVENLEQIATVADVPVGDVRGVINKFDPPEKLVAVEKAIVRMRGIQAYLDRLGNNPFAENEREALEQVFDSLDGWRSAVRRTPLRNSDNRCLAYGTITKYPFYAAFCDSGDEFDETSESYTLPLLAVFTLGVLNSAECSIDIPKIGRAIRGLCDPYDPNRLKLIELFDQKAVALDRLDEYFETVYTIEEFHWVGHVVKKLGLESVHPEKKRSEQQELFKVAYLSAPPDKPISKAFRLPSGATLKRTYNQLPFRTDSVNTDGLSPEETGAQLELLIAEPGAEFDVDLQARKLINYSQRDNQFIHWGHGHMNQFELEIFRENLSKLVDEEPVVALLLVLGICISRSPQDVAKVIIVNDDIGAGNPWENQLTLSPKNGFWRHPPFRPDRAFKPALSQAEFLVKTTNSVLIELPKIARELSLRLLSDAVDGVRIGDHLGITSAVIDEVMARWVKIYREENDATRISVAKICNFGLQQLLQTTQDPALVAQTFWCDTGISSQPYYGLFSCDQIQSAYSTCITPILGETGQVPRLDYCVGSNLLVKKSVVTAWIEQWAAEVENAKNLRDLDKLISVHNRLTFYAVAMLYFVTTHRDVCDPFESFSRFDTKTMAVVLRDKMTGGKNSGRLAFLTPMAVDQIGRYRDHLVGLSSRIVGYDKALARRIRQAKDGSGNLPFFFFLRTKNGNPNIPEPYQITRSSLEEMSGIGIPMNWPRTYFRTHMINSGVPAEFVNIQMGHLSSGQEFDGPYSALAISDIRARIQKPLDRMCEGVGWRPIDGLREYKTSPANDKIDQIHWVFGSQSRAQDRKDSADRNEKNIRKFVRKNAPQEFDASVLNGLSELVRDNFRGFSLPRVMGTSRDELIKLYPGNESEIRQIWPSMAKISRDVRSRFDADIMQELRAGRNNRQTLDRYLVENFDTLTREQWASLVIASSVLFGGLCQKKILIQLLKRECLSYQGYLWAELNEIGEARDMRRAWFFDANTGQIYLRGLERFGNLHGILWEEIEKHIRTIFKVRSVKHLIRNAVACHRFEKPGFVVGYFTGDIQSVSTSLKTWLRMASGQTFELENSSVAETRKGSLVAKVPSLIYPDYYAVLKTIRKLQKDLRVSDESPWVVSRAALEGKIEARISEIGTKSTFVPFFLEYTLEILRDGRRVDDLAVSSVRNYFNGLVKFLHEETWKIVDADDLDEQKLTTLYGQILDLTTDNNRPELASLLHDFHGFLQRKCNFPDVDFTDIEPRGVRRKVRVSVVTHRELNANLERLPRHVRFHQSVAVLGRLRTQEFMSLGPQKMQGNGPIVLDIERTAGKKSKSVSGYRKILIDNDLNEEIRDFVEFCSANGVARFDQIMGESERRFLQQKLREITGDPDLVTHSLRDTGISMGILSAVIPEQYWPPNFASPSISDEKRSQRQEYCVGTTGRERRMLWLEAVQSGHSSPAVSFASYFHFMDFVSMGFCNDGPGLSYQALAIMTGESQQNLRKIRSRLGNFMFAHRVIKRSLEKIHVPAPDIVTDLINFGCEVTRREQCCYPTSLKDVLEVIRLSRLGWTDEVISACLEITQESVKYWIQNSRDVSRFTGFDFNENYFINKKPWQSVSLSKPGEIFDRLFCENGRPDQSVWNVLIPFRDFYIPKRKGIFFYDEDDLRSYVEMISNIGVDKKMQKIVVSSGHHLASQMAFGFPSLATLKIDNIRLSSRTYRVKQVGFWSPHGIGVTFGGPSSMDSRLRLEDEIFMLAAVAWCVLGI
jgi:hypothetical protein